MIQKTLLRHVGLKNLDKYLSAWLILAIDTVISAIATILAYTLVCEIFTSTISIRYGVALTLVSTVASIISFYGFRTFRSVIRHSTLREVWKLGAAVVAKISLIGLYIYLSPKGYLSNTAVEIGMLLDALLTLAMLIIARLAMIVIYDVLKLRFSHRDNCKNVLVYGTEEKQIAMMMRLQNSPHYRIAGLLTYGKDLKRYRIANTPVYYFENADSIAYLVRKLELDAVLFATYDSAQEERERLIRFCTEAGVKVLISPPIDEVVDGKLMKQSIREIKIEDLLGRAEIRISLDEIRSNLEGKTILVTGAAGSIGSELCRQLAKFGVEKLVLFDNSETPIHNIRLELEERFPQLAFIPIIGDVRSRERLNYVFQVFKPQVVFHAAAYKHVPLMEENPCEAVLVNVIGTRNVADLALIYNIEKMVMISTDKAVNPTNVMGASKRLAEIYVQSLGQAVAAQRITGRTKFVTTRFGNVLGSNGSVIPRFREQIEKGGPVTVTHPDITRFFMTIPEACRLVMEAATMSTGNEIFIFDMGESVKISDLATRMIELAGFRVGEDIEIVYTGLRPGEKLYEEVLSDLENTKPTLHHKIRIAQVREYDYEEAKEAIEKLYTLAHKVDITEVVRLMKNTVPEFVSQNSQFEALDVTKTTHTQDKK